MERISVIGGGLMGAGIAEVCARAGLDTVVVEVGEEAAKAAEQRVRSSLDRAESRGKISSADLVATLGRITFSTDLWSAWPTGTWSWRPPVSGRTSSWRSSGRSARSSRATRRC